MGERDGTDPPSFEEISAKINDPHERLLAVAADADGEIPTRPLRERAEVKSGSSYYYLNSLVEWGLLELIGKRDTGETIPSNVYRLTERGREFVERPSATTWATREDIQRVEQQFKDLRHELRATQVAMNENHGGEVVDRIAEIREQMRAQEQRGE